MASNEEEVPKVNVWANVGAGVGREAVTKVVVYAIVNSSPPPPPPPSFIYRSSSIFAGHTNR